MTVGTSGGGICSPHGDQEVKQRKEAWGPYSLEATPPSDLTSFLQAPPAEDSMTAQYTTGQWPCVPRPLGCLANHTECIELGHALANLV